MCIVKIMKNNYYFIRLVHGSSSVNPITASTYENLQPLTSIHMRNGANSQILKFDNSYVLKRFNHPYRETKKLEYIHLKDIDETASNVNTIKYTWPKYLLLDEKNYDNRQSGREFAYQGYLMPRIHDATSLDDYFGKDTLCTRILIAYQLARSIEQLHQQGMAMGDISSNNILVTRKAHQNSLHTNIVLIDSDSFVVNTPTNELYRTLYHTDPYYCKRPNDSFTINDFQMNDAFGFAVLCFQLLMGINPFNVIDNPYHQRHQTGILHYTRKKYSEFLRLREFPLFSNSKYIYEGHQTHTLQQQFMKLPLRIQDAFNKSFTDTNYEVTPISVWVQHLETFVMRICNYYHLPRNDERLNQSVARADQIPFPKSSG
jgi:serine/threonine protein kinase